MWFNKIKPIKGWRTNSSVVSSNARYDKHEVECDDELKRKRLQVRPSRKCSYKPVLVPVEYQPKGSARHCWSQDLSWYISWHLQDINLTKEKKKLRFKSERQIWLEYSVHWLGEGIWYASWVFIIPWKFTKIEVIFFCKYMNLHTHLDLGVNNMPSKTSLKIFLRKESGLFRNCKKYVN